MPKAERGNRRHDTAAGGMVKSGIFRRKRRLLILNCIIFADMKNSILLMLLVFVAACTGNKGGKDNHDEREAYKCLEKGGELNGVEKHDSAIAVLTRGLSYEGAADTTKGMLNAELSAAYNMSGDMTKALEYGRKAMGVCRGNADTELFVILCGNTGIVYRRLGMNDSAAVCYRQGVEAAQRGSDNDGLAYLYNNLAVLYYEMERYDEGVEYSKKAKVYAGKAGDEVEYYSAMANEGIGYAKRGDNRRAARLLKEVFDKAENMNSTPLKLKVINYLLSAYRKLEDYRAADIYLAKGKQIAESVPDATIAVAGIKEAEMNLQLARGDYRGALATARQLEGIKEFLAMPLYKLRMVEAQCHAGLGNHRKAYMTGLDAAALQDSVRKGEVERQLSEYSVRFKTQEKELAITRLQQEKSEQRARLLSAVAVLTGVVAVLVVALLLANHRRKVRRQQTEIELARKYIEGMENERARLARELHDGACNDLLALGMDMRHGNAGKDEMINRVQTMRASLRRISHELMPPSFMYAGIDEIARDYLSHLVKPENMHIGYSIKGDNWGDVPDNVAYQLYRIIQEAVSNVIRHSACTEATVAMTCGHGSISLLITDNGRGNDGDTPYGKGIRSMRDRANSIGARMSWKSDNTGTRIELEACFDEQKE